MKGQKKCRSTYHKEFFINVEENEGNQMRIFDLKNVPALERQRIKKKCLFIPQVNKKRPVYICQYCVDHIKINQKIQNYKKIRSNAPQCTRSHTKGPGRPTKAPVTTQKSRLSVIDQIVADIAGRKFDDFEVCEIAGAIGKRISEAVQVTSCEDNSESRENELLSYSYESYYLKFNVILRSFLEGIVDFRFDHMEKQIRSKRLLSTAMDCVNRAMNSKYVSLPALAENLVMYCLSGSKVCADIMGHSTASGCYTTVKKTLKDLGKIPPQIPPSDVIAVIDNNQVMAKNWKIELESKMRTTTVTSFSALQFQSSLQFLVPIQCPSYWDSNNNHELLQKYSKLKTELNDVHAHFRLKYLENRLEKILDEVKCESSAVKNKNSDLIEKFSMKYDRVESRDSFCKIIDQQCITVNPNSHLNVKKVLDEILQKSFESNRKWVVLVCDGLPYGIAHKIIKNTYICYNCRCELKQTEIEKHHAANHSDLVLNAPRKYEKIVLRPGNGHFEINFVRAIFAVYFDLYIEPIVKACGFKSPKQLDYMKKAHNHHLAWQILEIVFESMSDELLRIFVHDQMAKGKEASIESYMVWSAGNQNPNFKSAETFVFTFLHSLFLFRAAIRQCNAEVALAAREKLSSIFYGFNHPRYREYTCSDMFWMLSLPEETKPLTWLQSTRRENSSFGQGIDFLLEERNYIMKHCLFFCGIPTFDQWKTASCITNKIDQIKKTALEGLSISERDTEKRNVKLNTEINAARMIYRKSEIFEGGGQKTFTTLNKQKIELDFLDCMRLCESNKEEYYKSHLCHKIPCIQNVVKFECDRMKAMSSNTIQTIRLAIEKKLLSLPQSKSEFYMESLKSANKKEEMCDILASVAQECEEEDLEETLNLFS